MDAKKIVAKKTNDELFEQMIKDLRNGLFCPKEDEQDLRLSFIVKTTQKKENLLHVASTQYNTNALLWLLRQSPSVLIKAEDESGVCPAHLIVIYQTKKSVLNELLRFCSLEPAICDIRDAWGNT